jgi:hypothetical protein
LVAGVNGGGYDLANVVCAALAINENERGSTPYLGVATALIHVGYCFQRADARRRGNTRAGGEDIRL